MSAPRIVWLVNHYALPPGSAGGTRHYMLAKMLKSRGWRAIVIAASTELNADTQRLKPGERWRLETLDGVEFLWLQAPTYTANRVGRLKNMVIFAARLWLLGIKNRLPKPDAIVGSSPQPFSAYVAWRLARRFRAKFYYEIRDLWPEGLIELANINARHPLMRLFSWIERTLMRRAHRIVTLLPNVKDYLIPLGANPEKIVWVPNGIDTSLFNSAEPPPARTPFTLMYFGAHGIANALDNLLKAMKILQDENVTGIQLRLVGDGPLKPRLMGEAEALGVTNVRFDPAVPKSSIPKVAAEADAFVFNLADAPVFNKYGISSNKLFDFMAAARPVIFCCRAGNNPVAEAQAGITVEPANPAALAAAIKQLAATSLSERQAMGQRAREHVVAHHSFDQLAQKFQTLLDS